MTSKDSAQDQELLDRYRRASDTDAAAPSEAVRSAILAESRLVAGQLAAKGSPGPPPPFDVSRPASNDSRWKITAFGTAGAALLAALLIAPRYWQSLPITRESAAPAASAPKMESIAPSRRSESSQEMAALRENAAPLDKKNSRLAQNYAPAPLALKPAPTPPPAAPSADYAQNLIGGHPMSSDHAARAAQSGALSTGAARAALERNALEPVSLQSASAAGDLAQATLLLDQGAAVDARDTLGRTPLLFAVAQNRIEVVRLLLARGADPNAADNAGLTPLQQATNKDFQDIAALLERAGAR